MPKYREETVSDDLAGEVVSALASGAGKTLAAEGIGALGRLAAALRDKFRREPKSRGTLEIMMELPDDADAQRDLTDLLRERCGQDPDFAAWLADLWGTVAKDRRADGGQTVNIVHGDVGGHLVQARDIRGGIRIGPAYGKGAPPHPT